MKENNKYILGYIVVIILIMITSIIAYKCTRNTVDKNNLYYYDKYTELKDDYQTVLHGNDSIIKVLINTLDTLKLKKPTVIYVGAQAIIDTTVVTNIIYDTINNTIIKCYGFEVKDDWVDLTGVACPDTTTFKLKLKDEFIISLGSKRGLFKPEYDVFVTSKNPYVKATDIGSIIYKPKPTKFGLGVQVGYGINSAGLSPYLGIGLSYNFLRL